MISPELFEEAASRLVDDRQYMVIDAPDEDPDEGDDDAQG